jgi:hypothetical protein
VLASTASNHSATEIRDFPPDSTVKASWNSSVVMTPERGALNRAAAAKDRRERLDRLLL